MSFTKCVTVVPSFNHVVSPLQNGYSSFERCEMKTNNDYATIFLSFLPVLFHLIPINQVVKL